MEVRSKAAAAAASVVPFHCVICFEEFTSSDRPPVVLPCGHTYVCSLCAKRLNRCMECREPLFLQMRQPKTPPPKPRPSPYLRGGRQSPTPVTPPRPSSPHQNQITPTPLPIPKNLVLLAMMEAAEKQAAVSENEEERLEENCDEQVYDSDRILSGMVTMSGPCGTYVVRAAEGLEFTSVNPHKSVPDPTNPESMGLTEVREPEDVDTKQSDSMGTMGNAREPVFLERGQTVQVVEFENGVAKLARNAGYILARSSQLVKVGDPLDMSCRLEGLLNTVRRRGLDLELALEENRRLEASLRMQLEREMEGGPTHPIISEPLRATEASVVDECEISVSTTTTEDSEQDSPDMTLETPEKSRPLVIMNQLSSDSDFDVEEYGAMLACPMVPSYSTGRDNLGGALIPQRRDPRRVHRNSNEIAMGCGTSILVPTVESFSDQSSSMNSILCQDQSVGQVSSSALEIPANFSSSFDAIDFRTGLSGHRALASARANSGQVPRGKIRMMSEHRGIARFGHKATRQKARLTYFFDK